MSRPPLHSRKQFQALEKFHHRNHCISARLGWIPEAANSKHGVETSRVQRKGKYNSIFFAMQRVLGALEGMMVTWVSNEQRHRERVSGNINLACTGESPGFGVHLSVARVCAAALITGALGCRWHLCW
jgi:hypothetical protein